MQKVVQKGFTLIELMIVVSVIGVLMTLAYPSYSSHMQKVRRHDARDALLQLAENQEKQYLINRTYSNTFADISPGKTTSPNDMYNLSVVSDGATFTVTAVAVAGAGQSGDPVCGGAVAITLTNAGVRAPIACWQ